MQIEVGKYYRTRNGQIVGPAHEVADRNFPFSVGGRLYTSEGRYRLDHSIESRFDLVGEVRMPLASQMTDAETITNPPSEAPADQKETPTAFWADTTNEAYAPLAAVLQDAHDQAAAGKGKQRHNGRGVAFDRQPIMEIGRMCGLGYPTGQAQKKTQEAVSMAARGERDAATAELLGAINYLAAAIILIRETNSGAQ